MPESSGPIQPYILPTEEWSTSYVTVETADQYLADRLNIEPWDDASETEKIKALKMATRTIDKLRFRGEKTVASQEHQFPRGENSVTPKAILEAVIEIALALLDGFDPGEEIAQVRQKNQGFGSARTTYDTEEVPEYLKYGIPNLESWRLISPYLLNTQNIRVDRV